jgi:hypothetical protein
MIGMLERFAESVCGFSADRTVGSLVSDQPRRDEGRTGRVRTIHPLDSDILDTFGTERC